VTALPGRSHLALAVAGLLAGTALANLAQLPVMERHEWSSYHAFVRSPSPDMAAIGIESSPTTRNRRGLYLSLHLSAPDVQLLLGPGTGLDRWQLYGLGRVARIVDLDYDPSTFAQDLDVTDRVVADDGEGHLGPMPFTISLADGDPQVLAVRLVGDRVDLIDLRLVPDAERQVLAP
jgi:hypothetical protein